MTIYDPAPFSIGDEKKKSKNLDSARSFFFTARLKAPT